MERIVKILTILFLVWLITLTPWGYEMGAKLFNNPVHNQIYCATFSLLDKHPSTKPELKYWKTYLSKCLISDKKQEQKIQEFLEKNKEKLKQKIEKIEFNLEKIDDEVDAVKRTRKG